MEIKIGTAGIPIAANSNDTRMGIKVVSDIGLQAMEVEFVRGIHMSLEKAKEVGKVANEYNIELSVHAPYYINLLSSDASKLKASEKRVLDTLERGHMMGATIIAVHAGYYGKYRERADEIMLKELEKILEIREKKDWSTLLGLETMGKQGQWGNLEEIVKLAKKIDIIPYVDLCHIFARNAGYIDYKYVFDLLESLKLKKWHFHFSGVEYSVVGIRRGNERWHKPIRDSKGPNFEEFAKELLKRKKDTTIICESPLLEQDAIYMKDTLLTLGYKFIKD